ncbi:MAG: hypothetical protein Q9202_007616 [Teloschistes flavicans]
MDDSAKNHSASSDGLAQDYVVLDTKGKTACNGKPAEEEEDDGLPEGWEEKQTPEGRTYYIDHHSKTSTWDPPCSSGAKRSSTKESQAVLECLPAGWEEREENGKRYYIDHNSRTTSWVRPILDDISTMGPLPKGWERRRTSDCTLRLYFVNHNDKTTTWDYPKCLLEATHAIGSTAANDTSASSNQDSETPKNGQ